jgi:periplasmic mercuric ion binding protein
MASELATPGNEITVGVKGMVCAFCAQGIEKSFMAQKEVAKVAVSLENKTVKITFKEGQTLSREKITELLKDAGYEAVFKG